MIFRKYRYFQQLKDRFFNGFYILLLQGLVKGKGLLVLRIDGHHLLTCKLSLPNWFILQRTQNNTRLFGDPV